MSLRFFRSISSLNKDIVQCCACPRLVEFRQAVAQKKRKQFEAWDYWGKPLPACGDHQARLLVVGLAPAAHGGNRTGRMFTGDRSGDWVYGTLYKFGFSSSPDSQRRDDGVVQE